MTGNTRAEGRREIVCRYFRLIDARDSALLDQFTNDAKSGNALDTLL